MSCVSHTITFDSCVIFARENRQRISWKEAAAGVCKSASVGLRNIPLTAHLGKSQQCLFKH